MLRRLMMSAALVALGAPGLLGNERTTIILTDGVRKTGEITSRPRDENVPSNSITLMANGSEQTFQTSQIAVLDFGGGQPAASELNRLPSGGHYLVLRNGVAGVGTYVNIAAGTTLVWRAEAGKEQRYALRDVARVYLNPQSAKVAYNATGSNTAVAARGSGPSAIPVPATQAWTDTGIDVQQGERVAISATGDVAFAPGRTSNAGGDPTVTNPAFPVSNWPVGALIGKVGASKPFGIGAAQTVSMPAGGRLMLGVNDTNLTDNSGSFQVTVTRIR